ncbi:hypothetical protein RIF29_20351 [Crotalaria pallida]|uniref:Uncharacterized protein n=1 Tax=Crotalaria pallida TaxID=3830 RepID=A0AAN9F5C6_CROPI
MPKKRGHPPKNTPQASSNQQANPSRDAIDPQAFDIMQLDEEDLQEIDNLSPKQAVVWLKNLDVIRDRIKGKNRLGHESNDKPVERILIGDGENPNIGSQPETTDVGGNPNMDSQPKTTDPAKVNMALL